jgi:hypothetical protein
VPKPLGARVHLVTRRVGDPRGFVDRVCGVPECLRWYNDGVFTVPPVMSSPRPSPSERKVATDALLTLPWGSKWLSIEDVSNRLGVHVDHLRAVLGRLEDQGFQTSKLGKRGYSKKVAFLARTHVSVEELESADLLPTGSVAQGAAPLLVAVTPSAGASPGALSGAYPASYNTK